MAHLLKPQPCVRAQEYCTSDGYQQAARDFFEQFLGISVKSENAKWLGVTGLLRGAEAIDSVQNFVDSANADTGDYVLGYILCGVVEIGGVIYVIVILIFLTIAIPIVQIFNILISVSLDIAILIGATTDEDRKKVLMAGRATLGQFAGEASRNLPRSLRRRRRGGANAAADKAEQLFKSAPDKVVPKKARDKASELFKSVLDKVAPNKASDKGDPFGSGKRPASSADDQARDRELKAARARAEAGRRILANERGLQRNSDADRSLERRVSDLERDRAPPVLLTRRGGSSQLVPEGGGGVDGTIDELFRTAPTTNPGNPFGTGVFASALNFLSRPFQSSARTRGLAAAPYDEVSTSTGDEDDDDDGYANRGRMEVVV